MKVSSHAFDAIIIGTGQSGKPLALALARAGRNTAVIERAAVGGSCINYGCTPTKTMIASARVAYLARRAAEYGVNAAGIKVDMARVRAIKQKVVERFRDSGREQLEKADKLELIFGEASFTDARTVTVARTGGAALELTAPNIIVNTGVHPAVPDIPGLREVAPLDSTSIMELTELPEHLLVLGGGYIALEFGQMFRRFGSRVTIVERSPRLLEREDADVSEAVEQILRDDGIDILTGAEAVRAAKDSAGKIELSVKTASGEKPLAGSHLLVAVGQAPNTETLNPAAADIRLDARGYIAVNDKLETSVSGIYAMGDVKGGPAFTHISYDDFRVLRGNLLEGGSASIAGRLVPNTIFIDPQLASVGLNETGACKQNRKVRIARLPMAHVARAIETGETRGFMKALVDAETGLILGCTILGIEGGEIMSMLQLAMMADLPYTRIRDGIFAHPTLAESLNNLFMTLD